MNTTLPALIMGFREGLEAFLIMVVIFQFLNKAKLGHFKKFGLIGLGTGIIGSFIIGLILFQVAEQIGHTEATAKLWESAASLIALALVTTFIYWMMHSGRNMISEIHSQIKANLSAFGIFIIAFVLVIREGAEVSIFSFAGEYDLAAVFTGIGISAAIAITVYYSLFRVNIKALFNITLGYLVMQAGYLLGYGIHEGLSALGELKYIDSSSWVFTKAFDLSETIFYHKEGIIGLPMNVLVGWYSKPEWIQLIAHYGYVVILFTVWTRILRKYKK